MPSPSVLWLGGGIMLALFIVLGTGADLAIAAWQKRRNPIAPGSTGKP